MIRNMIIKESILRKPGKNNLTFFVKTMLLGTFMVFKILLWNIPYTQKSTYNDYKHYI